MSRTPANTFLRPWGRVAEIRALTWLRASCLHRPALSVFFANLFLAVGEDTLLWFPISWVGRCKNVPFKNFPVLRHFCATPTFAWTVSWAAWGSAGPPDARHGLFLGVLQFQSFSLLSKASSLTAGVPHRPSGLVPEVGPLGLWSRLRSGRGPEQTPLRGQRSARGPCGRAVSLQPGPLGLGPDTAPGPPWQAGSGHIVAQAGPSGNGTFSRPSQAWKRPSYALGPANTPQPPCPANTFPKPGPSFCGLAGGHIWGAPRLAVWARGSPPWGLLSLHTHTHTCGLSGPGQRRDPTDH